MISNSKQGTLTQESPSYTYLAIENPKVSEAIGWLDSKIEEADELASFLTNGGPEPSLGKTQREVVQGVFGKLTNTKFCKQRPGNPEQVMAILAEAVQANRPFDVIIGHGPLKNVNNVPYGEVDWSEFFTCLQLLRMAVAIQKIYEPGIRFTFYLDDSRAAYANGVSWERMNQYRRSLMQLVQGVHFASCIEKVVSLDEMMDRCHYRQGLERAQHQLKPWLENPENKMAFDAMVLHAQKNMPPVDASRTLDEYILAAERYWVALEAEKLCGVWSQPGKVYMRYSPHPGAHQLFTLRRGSVTQPWQGCGALIQLDSGKWDPYLWTLQRSSECQREVLQVPTSALGGRIPQGLIHPLVVVLDA